MTGKLASELLKEYRNDFDRFIDPYEGHSKKCSSVHPGDNECNCHKSFGLDSPEDMEEKL